MWRLGGRCYALLLASGLAYVTSCEVPEPLPDLDPPAVAAVHVAEPVEEAVRVLYSIAPGGEIPTNPPVTAAAAVVEPSDPEPVPTVEKPSLTPDPPTPSLDTVVAAHALAAEAVEVAPRETVPATPVLSSASSSQESIVTEPIKLGSSVYMPDLGNAAFDLDSWEPEPSFGRLRVEPLTPKILPVTRVQSHVGRMLRRMQRRDNYGFEDSFDLRTNYDFNQRPYELRPRDIAMLSAMLLPEFLRVAGMDDVLYNFVIPVAERVEDITHRWPVQFRAEFAEGFRETVGIGSRTFVGQLFSDDDEDLTRSQRLEHVDLESHYFVFGRPFGRMSINVSLDPFAFDNLFLKRVSWGCEFGIPFVISDDARAYLSGKHDRGMDGRIYVGTDGEAYFENRRFSLGEARVTGGVRLRF